MKYGTKSNLLLRARRILSNPRWPLAPRILIADKNGNEVKRIVTYEGLDKLINTGYRNSDA